MEVNDYVRVIDPGTEFYKTTELNGADPRMIGREGEVINMSMNNKFEIGWIVKLTSGEQQFFYEGELEVIPEISGPVMVRYKDPETKERVEYTKEEIEAMDRPSWWDDEDSIRMMLFEVEVEGESFIEHFAPFFTKVSEVYQHLANMKGNKNE